MPDLGESGSEKAMADAEDTTKDKPTVMEVSAAAAAAPPTKKKDSSTTRSSTAWKKNVTFNLAHTHYQVIRDAISDLGYSVGKDSDKKCMVIWCELARDPFRHFPRILPCARLGFTIVVSGLDRSLLMVRLSQGITQCHPSR